MNKFEFEKNRRVAEFCPCGKSNHDGKFAPFVGFGDKGHCFSCDKTFFPDKDVGKAMSKQKTTIALIPHKHSFISYDIFKQSRGMFEKNTLLNFIRDLTNDETALRIKDSYQLGTAKLWDWSMVFWQIDSRGRVRDGKIIKYILKKDDSSFLGVNCGRDKETIPPVKWVSKLAGVKDFKLQQCFFGEHLLPLFPDKPIGILESEKSALIATAYRPDILWLASGGSGGLTDQKVKVLESRKVTLFPDLGKFDQWKTRAAQIEKLIHVDISVADFLERIATEQDKIQGLDLADFLLRSKWNCSSTR